MRVNPIMYRATYCKRSQSSIGANHVVNMHCYMCCTDSCHFQVCCCQFALVTLSWPCRFAPTNNCTDIHALPRIRSEILVLVLITYITYINWNNNSTTAKSSLEKRCVSLHWWTFSTKLVFNKLRATPPPRSIHSHGHRGQFQTLGHQLCQSTWPISMRQRCHLFMTVQLHSRGFLLWRPKLLCATS